MKILLLGAGGMLAHDLRSASVPSVELRVFTHADLDIADHAAVGKAIRVEQPDVILNAAGYTRVDDAESDWEVALAVNGAALGAIGRAAAEVGATVVHFSTDYVFDGEVRRAYREDDPPNPLSTYGRSKLEGETRLRESGARHLIIRTQWLFGDRGQSFPRTMWHRATQGLRTRVVADQTGRPTYATDLARAVWRLVGAGVTGVVHVANAGTATWFDVAQRVFQMAGAGGLLEPCTTPDYPRPARRPLWSVLDTSQYESLTGTRLRPWQNALDEFFLELSAARTRT